MSQEALQAQAWSALTHAWALRWALIVGVGSLPKLLPLLGRVLGKQWVLPRLAAQACALFAVLTCIYSLKLLPDTYRLESEEPSAIEALQCDSARAASGRLMVRCEDAEYLVAVEADTPQGPVTLYRLPTSRLVVGLRPLPVETR